MIPYATSHNSERRTRPVVLHGLLIDVLIAFLLHTYSPQPELL